MAFIPWSDDYLVNVRVIDNDHRALFEIVNSLSDSVDAGASSKQISSTLKALQDYVAEHFAREELYMKECGYPGYESHLAKHANLSGTVQSLVDNYHADPDKVDTTKLLDFLKDWLINHILKSDMDYAPYLRGEKQGDPAVKNGTAGGASDGKGIRTISIRVPSDDADVLTRFGTTLLNGGDDAEAVRKFAHKLAERAGQP